MTDCTDDPVVAASRHPPQRWRAARGDWEAKVMHGDKRGEYFVNIWCRRELRMTAGPFASPATAMERGDRFLAGAAP